ncbi:hypothetical protein WJX79_004969 [Trebouxia sp. C0005]
MEDRHLQSHRPNNTRPGERASLPRQLFVKLFQGHPGLLSTVSSPVHSNSQRGTGAVMGCGNSTLQHQHSLTKKYEAGTIRITAMASGLAPATPYFSPYTRNRVKQASAFAQRLQEVFTIYTPVAFNLATLGRMPASPEGMAPSSDIIRHSKIFCTLGPASATEALVQQLVTAGMDVGVLDLSTGNHKEHQIVLDRIRRVEADQACTVAVCMNTKRPNLFTGRLFGRQPLQLIAGQSVSLRGGSSDGHVEGGLDAETGRITIFVTTDALCQIVKDGSNVILGDDSIVLKVTSISSDKQCEATVTKALKPLGEHCQVIFPGCAIPSPCLAQPTFNDIKNFACAHRVDFVSAAYIQTAEDAQYLRRFMVECDHGETIRLIARIENEVGLRNIDDILGEADGIMLCRSSLAVELGPDKLGLMQKLVAAKAQAAGKFMVVEGQVMESMKWQPQALPCEMSDVAHAIFDGADALLLGAATSIGNTPVQAVQCTAAVISAADHSLDGRQAYRHIHKTGMGDSDSELIEPFEAIVSGAARAALDMRAGLIVVLTTTGQSAYLLARYRLGLPILVVSQSEEVMRRCNTVRALFPFPITQAPGDLLEAPLQEGLQHARDQGLCPSGCRVVVMAENLADGPDTLPVLFTRVAPGDAQQVWDGQADNRVHRTLCPQTASLSIADVVTTTPGPRHTKIMCVLNPAAFSLSTGGRHKAKRPEGLLARLSMGSAANTPSKGSGTPLKSSPIKMTAAASPVSGAIGAVQAGQLGAGQGGELVHELTALMEAGMDVACFDLSQGSLEQHLDLADHLVEVQQHAKQSGKQCAEGALNASAMLSYLKEQAAKPLPAVYTAAISAVGTALDCHACLIVTLSRGSQLPLAIAVGRPPVPQMLITDSKATARLCSPAFGIFDLVVDDMDDVTGLVAQARIIAQEAGLWNGRDSVVVVREDGGGAPLIAIQG